MRSFGNPPPPPPPQVCAWEQWGPSAWLPPSLLTPARAPPSSAQGVALMSIIVWGFAAPVSLPPPARGAGIPLVIWLCPYGRTRMMRRRSAWIDVFVPRHPEIRPLVSTSRVGLDCSRAPYPLLSLPPCLSLHRFFLLWPSSSYALALRFLRSGSSWPIRGGVLIIGNAASLHTQL